MAAAELQGLLRFLSQDAKIPLATAMGIAKTLQQASLTTADTIAGKSLKEIQSLLGDEKLARQVHNAAKKACKKRSVTGNESVPPSKRSKQMTTSSNPIPSSAELEASLVLPLSDADEVELRSAVFFTNRAPLLLAFVLTLLKYTMPEQPISSRLSLAYAYVSLSSRSRAVDLGIEKGPSAEESGWGEGQPFVTIMGKKIRVMRRSGYDPVETVKEDVEGTQTIDGDKEDVTALWGLDLEALKSLNLSTVARLDQNRTIPIYTPQRSREYLAKAATSAPDVRGSAAKKTAAERREEVEHNLGVLLRVIDLVYQSWIPEIGMTALDKKTWAWYASVRPDVAYGRDGWGRKNEVRASSILDLRKEVKLPKSEPAD